MDRSTRLAPLGLQRLRILECLGGNSSPRLTGYFDPADDAMIFMAFRDHVLRLSNEWSEETDPYLISLLAAERLLSGEIAAAETILAHLPSAPVVRDHCAGFCRMSALYAMSVALPIPDEWRDTPGWVRGSDMEHNLQAWLRKHADRLQWKEEEGCYRIAAERKENRP